MAWLVATVVGINLTIICLCSRLEASVGQSNLHTVKVQAPQTLLESCVPGGAKTPNMKKILPSSKCHGLEKKTDRLGWHLKKHFKKM